MRVLIAALIVVGGCGIAEAQEPPPRLEAALGGGIFGAAGVSEGNANLRANSTTPDAYRLFTAATEFARAGMLEARASWALTRRYGVEGRFAVMRPELRSSVTADAEGAPAVTVVERVDQYMVDAGVVVVLDELRLGGMVPFAAAGGGYLRQLHEGRTVVEQGHLYYVGGGAKTALFTRDQGFIRGLGLRADARVNLLARGIEHGGGPRPHAAFSGSVFVRF